MPKVAVPAQESEDKTCPTCQGDKKARFECPDCRGATLAEKKRCQTCGGQQSTRCPVCGGDGVLT
jgi:DnaJ-class molecular chaperone